MREKMLWNVPIHSERAFTAPTICSILSLISRAALLVNVSARMRHGATSRASSRYAILEVSTVVLPLPAPATTSMGPSVCTTASRC